MIYLDSSVLGALFFREPTAPVILARLETVDKGDLCVSAWKLLDTPALALRAGDALHLAIVRRMRARLATLDTRQSIAANHYGIPVFRCLDLSGKRPLTNGRAPKAFLVHGVRFSPKLYSRQPPAELHLLELRTTRRIFMR